MEIRAYRPGDCREMAELFHRTVHEVSAADYSPEQLDAWSDGRPDLEAWNRSFLSHDTRVAVEQGRVVGFADMDPSGYLDRLYVSAEHQREGIATALCDALERALRAERVVTHASLTARPFFERRGYRVIQAQQVLRRGVLLTNFVMEKRLGQ